MSTSEQYWLDAELELAARVQSGLLPKRRCCLAGWDIAFSYEAAHHVSGDYVDLIESGPDTFHFVVGDVSGKGVAAALLMAHLHATIRLLLSSERGLADVVRETSRSFCETSLPAQFVTLVVGTASRSGEVRLVNAGHLPVLVARNSSISAIPATSVPLGLFCGFETSAALTISQVHAEPGNSLLLYSDGVTETVGADESEYGLDRLIGVLERASLKPAHEIIGDVLRDLQVFSTDTSPADDRSILALRFQ